MFGLLDGSDISCRKRKLSFLHSSKPSTSCCSRCISSGCCATTSVAISSSPDCRINACSITSARTPSFLELMISMLRSSTFALICTGSSSSAPSKLIVSVNGILPVRQSSFFSSRSLRYNIQNFNAPCTKICPSLTFTSSNCISPFSFITLTISGL